MDPHYSIIPDPPKWLPNLAVPPPPQVIGTSPHRQGQSFVSSFNFPDSSRGFLGQQAAQVRSSKVTLGGDLGRGHGPRRWGVGDRPNPRDLGNSRPGNFAWRFGWYLGGKRSNDTTRKKIAWRIFAIIELWWGKPPMESCWGFNKLCLKIFHLHAAKQKIYLIGPHHPRPFRGHPVIWLSFQGLKFQMSLRCCQIRRNSPLCWIGMANLFGLHKYSYPQKILTPPIVKHRTLRISPKMTPLGPLNSFE